jgi:hypothetical protein
MNPVTSGIYALKNLIRLQWAFGSLPKTFLILSMGPDSPTPHANFNGSETNFSHDLLQEFGINSYVQ